MITFWIIVVAMIVVALAIVALPLLRKRNVVSQHRDEQNIVIARERLTEMEQELKRNELSQEEFDQAKTELEQALLLDLDVPKEGAAAIGSDKGAGRLALGVMLLGVPLLTVGLYTMLGSPELIDRQMQPQHQSAEGEMPSIPDMIKALVNRLKENPEDIQGWYMLGRTYMAVEDYPKAVMAYGKLYELAGDEPTVMLSYADALSMQGQGDMSGKPTELVRRAVELAPSDATALWMAGMVESQAGNNTKALVYLRKLIGILESPEDVAQVKMLIAQTEAKAGITPSDSGSAPVALKLLPPIMPRGEIRLTVELDPDMAGKVDPEDTLFIYARAIEGPKFPLAVVRKQVKDLPMEIALDDSGAMVPEAKLSNFRQVVIGARISKSGNAIAVPGDLYGEKSPVKVGTGELFSIFIDAVK